MTINILLVLNNTSPLIKLIYFHLMHYRDFKHYYLFHVCRNMTSEFPNLVSYNRFVELSNKSLLPLVAYLRTQYLGKCTGISFIDGIHLITKIRKNMKNSLMLTSDKIMLRKRALVETVFDELKTICRIEHTRYRSQGGFIVNLISRLIAYYHLPKKPSLNLEVVDPSMALVC